MSDPQAQAQVPAENTPAPAQSTQEGGAPRGDRREGRRGGRREGGFGGKRRGPRRDRGSRDKGWTPVTKLGRLVQDKKITSLEQIYIHSYAIKEYQIIDYFLKSKLKDEVMKISPVQKQTTAGQRTRFKAYVAMGDHERHAGLGIKCAAEVATAIRGAIILGKLSLIPVRLGYWGNRFSAPHTVPAKVSGKCGSVMIRLIPAPRGTGIVASPVPKKLLDLAGVHDCFSRTSGHTKTLGNFVKATFEALKATYGYLTPDLWDQDTPVKTPYEEFSTHLATRGEKKPEAQEKKYY